MYKGKTVSAILPAAGSGTRFGVGFNKVFAEIRGRSVYSFSLSVLSEHPSVDEILIVAHEGEEKLFDVSCLTKPVRFVKGGATRRESVLNAVNMSSSDIVIIQDAARPFIKRKYIDDCLMATERCSGAAVAIPAVDTIKIADREGYVQETPVRSRTYQVQTPQCFDRATIIKASAAFDGSYEATDECTLLEHLGEKVALIPGSQQNIKITSLLDLKIAEVIADIH